MMTTDFVTQIRNSENVLYFPYCDWLFPNGLKINNVLFTIPWFNDTSIDVYWYGFLIAFGMLLAVIYASTRMRKFGLDTDRAIDVILAGLVGAIIGARAYYVIFNMSRYLTDEGGLNLKAVFSIRDGGLAIYGGVIGALIFGGVVAMIRKVKLTPMLDLMGLGLLIGQCLGRWGNFFNQECYGVKTSLPWGMTSNSILNGLYFYYYPENVTIVTNRARDMVAHPCFLYESLWCLIGFVTLHIYSERHRKFDGEIFLLYIGWYGAGRFWIEGLRTDSLFIPGTPLKVSQLVAGTCVIFSIVLLIFKYASIRKNGNVLYCDTEESKELIALHDERIKADKNRRGKGADAEVNEHILADDVDSDEDSESVEDSEDKDSENTESAEDAAELSEPQSVDDSAEDCSGESGEPEEPEEREDTEDGKAD